MLNDFPVARGDRDAFGSDSVDLRADGGVLFFKTLRRLPVPFIAADIDDARVEQMPLYLATAAARCPSTFIARFVGIKSGHYFFPALAPLAPTRLFRGTGEPRV